jgi:homoserine O-acetyltransferase/O-succinyltransferase
MPTRFADSAPPVAARAGTVTLPSLPLADGLTLSPVTIAYESWGTLDATASNAILICHALTGNAHAYDAECPDDPRTGWWNPLIGPGRTLDTDRYFVICTNVIGSCYGSSGPTSIYPGENRPYGLRFPQVTISDMVRAQYELLQQLGIRSLTAVIGGSLGGLQALEWTLKYPDKVKHAIIIAAAPRLSSMGLAIDTIGRQAIMRDPDWQNGDYEPGQGPDAGLGLARMLAMLTYTSPELLETRFGRKSASRPITSPVFGQAWDVESYLLHQADKLVERFDANAYLYLTSAMDRYDATEERGSPLETYARIRADVLAIGVDSDWLYPAEQVCAMVDDIRRAGGRARYAELHSPNGHDAFLQEWSQLAYLLRTVLGDAHDIYSTKETTYQ